MFAAKKNEKKKERASPSSSSSSSNSESSSESSSDSEESDKESKKQKKKVKKQKKKQKKDKKKYFIYFHIISVNCFWCVFILNFNVFTGQKLKVLKRKNKKSWLHRLYVLKKYHPFLRIDSS